MSQAIHTHHSHIYKRTTLCPWCILNPLCQLCARLPRGQVVDPVRASYGVDNALYAVGQLAQTTMRSELGKITLDKTFEEREALNANIVRSINEAAEAWGLQCLRRVRCGDQIA